MEALLADERVDPNIGRYQTPLHRACSYFGSLEVVQALVADKRTDVNKQDSHGMTALHWAVTGGGLKVVEALLAHERLDLNIVDEKGKAAIEKLVDMPYSKLPIMEMLLADERIDPDAKLLPRPSKEADELRRKEAFSTVKVFLTYSGCGRGWAAIKDGEVCAAIYGDEHLIYPSLTADRPIRVGTREDYIRILSEYGDEVLYGMFSCTVFYNDARRLKYNGSPSFSVAEHKEVKHKI